MLGELGAADRLVDPGEQVLEDAELLGRQIQNLTADGRTILCEWHNTPLIDEDGKVYGVASFAQDITERKTAQDKLRASEQRYRGLFEQSPLGFIIADKDTRIAQANNMAARMLGYTKDQLIGVSSADLIHPDDIRERPVIHPDQEEFRSLPTTFERRYKCADGSYLPVEVNVANTSRLFW